MISQNSNTQLDSEKISMIGYVYILVNSAFPNLVKIGRTSKDSFSRADELSSTGSPSKFVVAYDQLVSDSVIVESLLHEHFNEQRYAKNREFFEVSSKVAIDKLIEIAKQYSCDSPQSQTHQTIDYFSEPSFNHFIYLAQIGLNDKKDVFYRIGALSSSEDTLSKNFLNEVKKKLEKFYKLNNFGNYFSHEIDFLELHKTELASIEFQTKSQELVVKNLSDLLSSDEDASMTNGWKTLDFDGQSFVFRKFEKYLSGAQYFYGTVQDAISSVRIEHEQSVSLAEKENEKQLISMNYLKSMDELGGNF